MKSRNIRLLIMLGVLVLAVAVYVLVVLAGKEDTDAAVEETVRLMDIDNTTVTGLGWSYNGSRILLEKGADNSWRWAEDESCPISTAAVEGLINSFSSITAMRTVTNAAPAAEYGLDTPSYEYTASLVSGHTITLSLGDYSSYAGGYYAAVSGNDTVYIVAEDIITGFSVGIMDLLQYESAPDLSAATELTVTTGGNSLTLRYYADSSGMSYSDSYHWFLQRGTGVAAASTDKVTELLASISGINWLSCVAYDANAQLLADCGIGAEGSTKVVVTYPGADGGAAKFTLLFGNYVNGSCYANIEGSTMLYTVTGASADRFILLSADDVRATELCMVDADRIMSFSIRLDDVAVQIDNAGKESSTDSSGELVSIPVWQREGVKLAYDDVAAFIEALTAVQTDYAVSEYGRGELLRVTVVLDSGEELSISFYTYSSTQALAIRDGKKYLVSLTEVEPLVEAARVLMPTEA